MKKIITSFLFVFCSLGLMSVQAQDNAIGLRLGWDAEVSYQRYLSSANRIEADLGISFGGGANLAGVYQWVWDLSQLAPGFKWYAGAGAGLGLWSKNFAIGALGNIGIEYNFGIPLQLALDWRPGLYFVTGGAGLGFAWEGFALGVRYKF